MAHCHWQKERSAHPALVALHGLEGSSSAHYMRGIADKGFRAGFNVVLLNQRNCGGTERYGPGLYHSGLTSDARVVLGELSDKHGIDCVVVAGYSLGGNLALKLAGEYGDAPPPQLRGVAAVLPVMDLAACVAALERRRNVVYHLNFVRGLRGRMRRKAEWYPGRYANRPPPADLERPRVRRGVHRPAFRLRERRRLLSPGQRPPGRRPDSNARAGHHGRERSVRAARRVSRPCDRVESSRPRDHHASRRSLWVCHRSFG